MKQQQDKKPRKSTKKQENTSVNKPERDEKGRLLPGNTANPNGKPPGAFSLLAILKAELQKCPEGQDKRTYGELIVKRMLKESIEKGDQQQIKLIWNYIEGMPKQNIEVDNPAQVEAIKSLENIIKEIRK